MSKRGRPRKAGLRKPCGRLAVANDTGTDELLMHRAWSVSVLNANEQYAAIKAGELALSAANSTHEENVALKLVNGSRRRLWEMASDRRLSDAGGILRANNHITGGQHYALNRYASLYQQAVKRFTLPSTLGNMVGTGGIRGSVEHDTQDIEERNAETRQAYLAARKILDKQGREVSAVVDNVAVFDIIPTMAQLPDLRRGLEALREHFEEVGRRK
jgi:hypothetical protein